MSTTSLSTQPGAIDLEELAEALDVEKLGLDKQSQRVAVSLYRLLAEGAPVTRERLAERTGLPLEQISELVDSWFGIYFNDDGDIVALWGLAQPEMAFSFEVDGRQLYTWCAWDSLFLPQILHETARVEVTAPTGETISLTVGPDGISDLSPAGAVLSFLRPDDGFDENVIQSFCHYVLFFPSQDAAKEWTADHPNTFLLSIEQGFELGCIWIEKRFGAGLDAADLPPA